ncbi:MAG: DNA methyltransferase [Candidatus Methanosuratincola sp.]
MEVSSERDYRGFVEEFIPKIHSVEDIYGLFKGLGYPLKAILDPSYKRRISEFGFAKEEEEKIANIYTVLSIEKKLNVFLVETKSQANVTVRFLRYLAKVFSDNYMYFLLIVTGDFRTFVFVLPDFERKEVGEVKLKIIRLQVDVSDPYYTDKQTIASLGLTEQEKSWRDIWLKWRDAFSVKRVTEEFFDNFAGLPTSIFMRIKNDLVRQKTSRKDAHEFALLLLSRIMFVYFVAKKRWLNNDPRFMRWLWQRYLKERNNRGAPADSFYEKWLKTIFFEAFNNKFTSHPDLPEDVNRIFYTVPYLNGGLFREGDIDKLPVKIKDDLLKEVFEFFERYNFTIREDLPFDVEVAVDPQMIGYVYESLANVAEEIYDRNDLGIFYTPRVEVDFMCRRSVVEYLHNHLPNVSKELWYKLVFDEDTEKVEKQLSELNVWYDLEEKLDSISVVDPACGSGAFLVGMLNVLTDLYKIVNRNLGLGKSDFEIKKRIVGKSLYGVDVMPWAVHAAELRLWLQLVVESPLEPKDLKTQPLLPNLNMNLRVGDSLVQEIGGMTLHLRDPKLSEKVKKKLIELKQEKENYINNVPTAKFKRKEEVQKEEIRVFQEIIEERLLELEDKIKSIRNKIKGEESQKTLSGERAILNEEKRKKIEQLKEQIERYNKEEYELKKIKENLTVPEKKPFVWEVDFAEVFGEKAGFDIVIGNPPYVRQELISPPNKLKEEVELEDKRKYKEKLQASVISHFPVLRKIDKKSDYYVYFYFHGLALLNQKGTFCFVTSNSWLDVDYGKELQEFILKYVPIIAICDNQSKRTFEHADINTIIVFFGAPLVALEKQGTFGGLVPEQEVWPALSNVARFVMFKKPFEEVVNSKNLIDIENTDEIVRTDAYRVYAIRQDELLEDGWEYPENYDSNTLGRFKQGQYAGNKLGGKYLRAPDIFFTILQKGKDKLIRLGDIATARRGFTTGANEFFYMNEETAKNWRIESRFLKPVIKSPRECKSILVNPKDLEFKVFMCHKEKSKLKGTNALKYIQWGEKAEVTIKQGTKEGQVIRGFQNIATIASRRLWYSLNPDFGANIFIQMSFNDIFKFIYSPKTILGDARVYEIKEKIKVDPFVLCGLLNSTLSALFIELFGRANLGQGALDLKVYEAKKIYLLNPKLLKLNIKDLLDKLFTREIMPIFEECGLNRNIPIREQQPKPKPDRKELDDIIFDVLGLSDEERMEFYLSVCELVKNRIEKAESFRRKEK